MIELSDQKFRKRYQFIINLMQLIMQYELTPSAIWKEFNLAHISKHMLLFLVCILWLLHSSKDFILSTPSPTLLTDIVIPIFLNEGGCTSSTLSDLYGILIKCKCKFLKRNIFWVPWKLTNEYVSVTVIPTYNVHKYISCQISVIHFECIKFTQ